MIRLLILTGAVVLSFAPIHAKTHCRPAFKYSVYYRQPAYIQGFNDGYDGLDYNNVFQLNTDIYLYNEGYLDGNTAYIEDNIRYNCIKRRF